MFAGYVLAVVNRVRGGGSHRLLPKPPPRKVLLEMWVSPDSLSLSSLEVWSTRWLAAKH